MEPHKTEKKLWQYRWTKTPIERFEDKYVVDPDTGCWVWTATRHGKHGYGSFYFEGKHYGSHRWSYEYHVGPIPKGLHLDHLCRNPPCVNPAHLEPVTPGENVLRGVSIFAQQKRRTHCPQGHPYDGENTMVTRRGERKCRECNRQRNREWKARRRAASGTS